MASFQWSWMTANPHCSHAIIWCWISQKRYKIHTHSYNEIPTGTYSCPTQVCHLKRSQVTTSELAKYSMTRSIAQSLCDSWATCWDCQLVAWSVCHRRLYGGGLQLASNSNDTFISNTVVRWKLVTRSSLASSDTWQ